MSRTSAAILFTLLATPAIAAGVLPFEGAFGNGAGCHLYATGEGKGDYQLLTADTFAARAVACDFLALESTLADGFTVEALCGRGKEALRIIDHGADGFGVRLADDLQWGPLKACPPVDLDAGPGMRS